MMSNEEVRRRARTCTISEQVKVANVVLDRAFNAHGPPPESCFNLGTERKRSRGRPKATWRRTVEGESLQPGRKLPLTGRNLSLR